MSKLSPRFVKYFIFASLALAFIFPITHSAYEGLSNKEEEDYEDEEKDVKEGLTGDSERQLTRSVADAMSKASTDMLKLTGALSTAVTAQAKANISQTQINKDKAKYAKQIEDAARTKAIASLEKVENAKATKK